ncbi:MAG: hypothetical protein M3Y81_29535, partial [Chloroflexota bacterium]|nr:hypothetical protein [Chloroflexota bacterium]
GQRRPYMKQGRAAREDLWERAEPGISCRGAAGLRPAPTTRGMPDDAPLDLTRHTNLRAPAVVAIAPIPLSSGATQSWFCSNE